ncbi:hypothetical protein NFI88_12420 [Acetobacteraceae bacterium KSS12]|uniref:Transketolase-like pyrimidine-binding domain-containing protein n=2 Tax=Rhizosaccharibacter radicis TaxID=2782605 RepID=A0ABT1VZ69_9PROT|nr:hypothetical protein [Acetobacteraceae bacterium KSS12]
MPELAILHSQSGAPVVGLPVWPAQPTPRLGEGPHRPGRSISCGVQEHGMAALANGLSLHGGVRPCLSAALVSIDRMRPALRSAAVTGQAIVYLLAEDARPNGGARVRPGDDEMFAAWQPLEQIASLRAMPEVFVFRPAGAEELVACWELALRRAGGPSLVLLGADPPPRPETAARKAPREDVTSGGGAGLRLGCARGGYVVAEADGGRREATLLATGPEVSTALQVRRLLARGEAGQQKIAAAVVSLPCWELFATQSPAYRAAVLGEAPRIGLEAASGFGWERWLGPDGAFIGMDGFGAMAADRTSSRRTALTPEAVASRVRRHLGASGGE